MSSKKTCCFALVAASIATFGSMNAEAATMTMPAANAGASSWRTYFRANSLEFPQIFRAHHPGPGWILGHREQLHLTPSQVVAEQKLAAGMVAAAQASVTRLQAAYGKYQAEAALASPSQAPIIADIKAVGLAQTQVGLAMVPYHFKAYALLTPEQKGTFRELVATPATP
jgi:Spy/CpxP family protein refolding chaperone